MNKEFAWFLGMLLSDGSITRPKYRNKGDESHIQFCIKNTDKEVLYKIKNILNTRATIHEYPNYKSPQAKLRIYDRKDIISEYGDIKTKVPDSIKGFERHFLRGICDGDGCIYVRKNRHGSVTIQIINECKDIIDWVYNIVEEKLGIEKKESRYTEKDHIYEFRFEGRVARMIIWWMYHGDIEHCSLNRKRNKYKNEILSDETNDYDLEIIDAVKASIVDDNIIPNVSANLTLKWCHIIQKQLKMKTTPVFHNKGKTKYYMLHINKNQ